MGHITTLPAREEKKTIEGGVERLLLRTDLDRQGKWHYLESKVPARKEEAKSEYRGIISRELGKDLNKMDRHQSDIILERILQILERPDERGQAKRGAMAGIDSLKFEGKSYVLLFGVRDKTVAFYGYFHHNVAYDAKKILPLIARMEFIPLDQWIAEKK